jgi:hypothetical protein
MIKRLAQTLEHMTLACGQLTAADHAHIGDRVVGRPKGARGDEGGAPTRQASDAMNPGGLQCLGQAHRRQDGGEAPRQHGLPRPWGPEEQEIMDRTPAQHSISLSLLGAQLLRYPPHSGFRSTARPRSR